MEDPKGPSMGTPIYYVGLACSLGLGALCTRAPQSLQSHQDLDALMPSPPDPLEPLHVTRSHVRAKILIYDTSREGNGEKS